MAGVNLNDSIMSNQSTVSSVGRNYLGSNPLAQLVGGQRNSMPNPGRTLQYFMQDGTVFAEHAKRTGTKCAMIQPNFPSYIPEVDAEFLGMLSSTSHVQTQAVFMMTLDLFLLGSKRTAYVDTRRGQKINFNLVRVYVAETGMHKSILSNLMFFKAIGFAKSLHFDIGFFRANLPKTKLVSHMAKCIDKKMLIIEDELSGKIIQMRGSRDKDVYAELRIAINTLADGEPPKGDRTDFSAGICKFSLIGFGQIQPTLLVLEGEKHGGDAFTRKIQLWHLTLGQEMGNYGPKLNGIDFSIFSKGILLTMKYMNKNRNFRWLLDDEGQIVYDKFMKDKDEKIRAYNRQNLHTATTGEDNGEIEDIRDNLRDEYHICRWAASLQMFKEYMVLVRRYGTFFIKEGEFSYVISKQSLLDAIDLQRAVNQQRKAMHSTCDVLLQYIIDLKTAEETDKAIKGRAKSLDIVREIVQTPCWFCPLKSILRKFRNFEIQKSEIYAAMSEATKPFGHFEFFGKFVQFNGIEVFIKSIPEFVHDDFLLQHNMTKQEYCGHFYSDLTHKLVNFRGDEIAWQHLCQIVCNQYPSFGCEKQWFIDWRNRFRQSNGTSILDFKNFIPEFEQRNVLQIDEDDVELLKQERFRGLENPTDTQILQRLHYREVWYRALQESLGDEFMMLNEIKREDMENALSDEPNEYRKDIIREMYSENEEKLMIGVEEADIDINQAMEANNVEIQNVSERIRLADENNRDLPDAVAALPTYFDLPRRFDVEFDFEMNNGHNGTVNEAALPVINNLDETGEVVTENPRNTHSPTIRTNDVAVNYDTSSFAETVRSISFNELLHDSDGEESNYSTRQSGPFRNSVFYRDTNSSFDENQPTTSTHYQNHILQSVNTNSEETIPVHGVWQPNEVQASSTPIHEFVENNADEQLEDSPVRPIGRCFGSLPKSPVPYVDPSRMHLLFPQPFATINDNCRTNIDSDVLERKRTLAQTKNLAKFKAAAVKIARRGNKTLSDDEDTD